MKRFVAYLALTILPTIVLLGVCELACRFFYSPERMAHSRIFEYDREKVYALKKNYRGRFTGKEVLLNSYGHRDTEIPLTKGLSTSRILIVGDSVTFGHGVLGNESYPNVLERMLRKKAQRQRTDVINTGVPGNSPFQEYYDLERGLKFSPDVVVIQFTLNDVIEPYKVFRRYGGEGKDYHGVEDMGYFNYVLAQNSAFYLFLKDLYARLRIGELTLSSAMKKARYESKRLDWNAAAVSPDSEKVKEAWDECLKWMKREIELAKKHSVKVVLLATPVKFQWFNKERRYPQKVLGELARRQGIQYIDLLKELEDRYAFERESSNIELERREFWEEVFSGL